MDSSSNDGTQITSNMNPTKLEFPKQKKGPERGENFLSLPPFLHVHTVDKSEFLNRPHHKSFFFVDFVTHISTYVLIPVINRVMKKLDGRESVGRNISTGGGKS